jgi:anti-sigma B factor antagonist
VQAARQAHNFAVHVHVDTETVVALSGELDLATAPMLKAALDRIPYPSVSRLLLDLEALSFLDACGLRTVLSLEATCWRHSVELTIRRGPRGVQRVFELTHTDLVLPFEPE